MIFAELLDSKYEIKNLDKYSEIMKEARIKRANVTIEIEEKKKKADQERLQKEEEERLAREQEEASKNKGKKK
jgi:hypothetical protein